jgi:hypothetical protein
MTDVALIQPAADSTVSPLLRAVSDVPNSARLRSMCHGL